MSIMFFVLLFVILPLYIAHASRSDARRERNAEVIRAAEEKALAEACAQHEAEYTAAKAARPKRKRGRPRKNPPVAPVCEAEQRPEIIPAAPQAFPIACMLAKKYADDPHAIDGKSFTVTEKLDGVRCIARVDHERVALYTRSGNRIEGLNDIENALAALNVSAMLDGELLIAGRGALPSKEEYKKTCSIVRSDGVKTGVVYHVFDTLPLAEYDARRSVIPYSARRATLERMGIASPHVEVVPALYSGTDAAQIEVQQQAQRAARHEGVMINLNDAPYSFTRTASLLKYKIMSDCDLRIVAVNPGTGRHAGMAGSISVSYKGGVVRVSAGLTIAQRRAIWADPAAYIGRVATVQYFEETQNSSGQKSLRFPVFKELREAGKSVSYA